MRARLETVRWGDPERFAAVLLEVVREAKQRFPPPANLPFFGLDLPEGCHPPRLESLSAMGIFRRYERVLDVPTGLGGPARWLARRHGCRVVSFGSDPRAARAARRLSRSAGLERPVAFGVANLASLPVASGTFTHAWSAAGLSRTGCRLGILRELWRALRPGGHVGVQELAAVGAGRVAPGEGIPRVEELVEELRCAGFEQLRVVELGAETGSSGPVEDALARRLAGQLGEAGATIDPPGERRDAGLLRVQIFGTKPG